MRSVARRLRSLVVRSCGTEVGACGRPLLPEPIESLWISTARPQITCLGRSRRTLYCCADAVGANATSAAAQLAYSNDCHVFFRFIAPSVADPGIGSDAPGRDAVASRR